MTLEELNKMSSDAERLTQDAKNYEEAAAMLAALRNGEATLENEIYRDIRFWTTGAQNIARSELFAVLNGMAHDIIRIAEMRLAATTRQTKAAAAAKRAAVSAYCGDGNDTPV